MQVGDIRVGQCLYFPVREKGWKYPRIFSGIVRRVNIEAPEESTNIYEAISTVYLSTEAGTYKRVPELCFERAQEAEGWLKDRTEEIKAKAIRDKKRKR